MWEGDEAGKGKEAELSILKERHTSENPSMPAKIYESNTFYHIETKGTLENKVKLE